MKKAQFILMLIGVVLLISSVVSAATINWNNPLGGSWNTPTNWMPPTLPIPIDDVVVNVGGAITVDYEGTINSFVLDSVGDNTLTLESAKLTIGGAFFATVDSAGGTIQFGDLTIQIPPGAVSQPTDIAVAPVQPDMTDIPDATAISNAYHIEVRGDLLKPVTVTISPITVPFGTVFAAMVDDLFTDMYNATPGRGTKLFDVSTVNGEFIVTLPENVSSSQPLKQAVSDAGLASTRSFTIYLLAGYCMRSSEHFNIRYPCTKCNVFVMDEWLQYAEEAYTNLVQQMKFDPIGLAMPLTRMTMDVVDLGPTEWGGLSFHTWTLGLFNNLIVEFQLPVRVCSAPDADQQREMKVTVGHEFFHGIQNTYDPAHALIKAVWNTRGLCLYDASSTWFEGEMLNDRSYIGSGAREQIYEANPFYTKGLGFGCASDPQNYGYGASTFLRYLTEKYGIDLVLVIWTNILDGAGFHVPIDALLSSGIDVVAEWENFSKDFLLGTTGVGWPIPNPDNTLAYKNAITPLQINDNMYQLSAKKHKLDFTSLISMPDSVKCSIMMNQGDYTTAYLYHSTSQVAMVTTADDTVFKPTVTDEYSLIVVNTDDNAFAVNGIRYGRQTPVQISIECTPVIITSVSPDSGTAGTTVTITGTGFGNAQGTVTFNGTDASIISSWTDTSIVVKVPAGATTGDVIVRDTLGVRSNGVLFTVELATPSITSLSPISGPSGTPVIIKGTGFGNTQGAGYVTFDAVIAAITSWSDTAIVAMVPELSSVVDVEVINSNSLRSNKSTFTIMQIYDLSEYSGPPGTLVTIMGIGFGMTPAKVTFNGTSAAITSWTDTTIVVTVPTGSTTGEIVVTDSNEHAVGGFQFTVIAPIITHLFPDHAIPGAVVTIDGTGFGNVQGTIYFNGISASVTDWSDVQIQAWVPDSATAGDVVVINQVTGVRSNGMFFTVDLPFTLVTPLVDQSIPVGSTFVFSVGGNCSGTIDYKWYWNQNDGYGWRLLAAETAASYSYLADYTNAGKPYGVKAVLTCSTGGYQLTEALVYVTGKWHLTSVVETPILVDNSETESFTVSLGAVSCTVGYIRTEGADSTNQTGVFTWTSPPSILDPGISYQIDLSGSLSGSFIPGWSSYFSGSMDGNALSGASGGFMFNHSSSVKSGSQTLTALAVNGRLGYTRTLFASASLGSGMGNYAGCQKEWTYTMEAN